MGYSVFEETMADMTYQDIELAAEEKAIVLLPVGVIEEHGPHMCLGTDTYLSYHVCRKVKKNLVEKGIRTLIAPPYYWGINNVTGAFAGSFTVRKSTMKAVLADILTSLDRWGFKNVFVLNWHGDYQHGMTILDAIRESRIDYGVRAYSILWASDVKRFRLGGKEEYILVPQPEPSESVPPQYVDVHAGSGETSLMLVSFPELVDIQSAKKLESSKTTRKDLTIWQRGWSDARKVTPLGYCGDPSRIDVDGAKKEDISTIQTISDLIARFLEGHYEPPEIE